MARWLALLFLLELICRPAMASAERVITLSPHLTEWVYSLNSGEQLVAVSEFSNYPEQAQSLPTVANHHGINLKDIVALEPTLILAWEGGNKAQDIARLRALGYEVFSSSPQSPRDISREIRLLGNRLGKAELAQSITEKFDKKIADIKQRFSHKRKPVFYYYWDKPLMTIGPDTWANKLLNICGAQTLFADSPVNFPEVSVEEVLKRQPGLLIASSHQQAQLLEQFWVPHRPVLAAPLLIVNPDVFSRFTLRLPEALSSLCEEIARTYAT